MQFSKAFLFIIYFSIGLTVSVATSRNSEAQKKKMSQQKFKILCLHGLGQNRLIFSNKTGSIRKKLRNLVDFVYIDAPYILQNSSLSNSQDVAVTGEKRTWFHPDDDIHSSNIVHGFNESISYVENVIKTQGPFDGILGFSQGAVLLGLICCLKVKQLGFDAPFKFVIFVSGAKSNCPAYEDFYSLSAPIDIPCLHMWGLKDRVVSSERSEDFNYLFDTTVSNQIVHPAGHYLPGHPDVAAEMKLFLRAQKKTKPYDPIEVELANRSIEARQNAHCPYSKFQVGAALLCKDGTIFTGCNVENASYPMGTCAEKTAICKAISEGNKDFEGIAVSALLDKKFVAPCGSCRQVIAEFSSDMKVLIVRADRSQVIRTNIAYLLPLSFSF